MIFKIINGKAVRYDSAGGITKIDDLSVDFSQAESRENIAPTDTMKIILGKIMKWFSDLSAGAASSLLGQNLAANKALISDANGKVAASAVDASKVGFLSGVTSDVQSQINSLNSAKQNKLDLGLNSISDIDSVWEGVTWYNADKNPSGDLPYPDKYGFILSFKANNSNRLQIAIPYSGDTINVPKFRSYTNARWQAWRTF